MMWRNVGYLCTKVETYDKFNRPQISYTEKLVYCNKKSVRQSEFYQAQASGLKPELVVEVKEYNGEEHFKFDNKLYRIIRTYTKSGETIELVLTSTLIDNVKGIPAIV